MDWRDQNLISHSIKETVGQRVMQIACGYEDADDCDSLRKDSMLKMSCGRLSVGEDLCSQPTMTRLENHLASRELYAIGEVFISNFIESYSGKIPSKIILDFDDSNANVYGGQQLSPFNQYYGEYCFMPLFVFEGYSGKMVLPIILERLAKAESDFIRTKEPVKIYSQFYYEAKSWKKGRWVIVKVEFGPLGKISDSL